MRKKILLTFLFLCNAWILLAQDPGAPEEPQDCDPLTEQCPLDTWVVIFALSALIITTIYLYKKQKETAELLNQ
jgi:hypothetical protein